ncbi:hypothetical protein [Nubsella zeaxanthinifaciens]|jgi:PBP1b-binding outer membrane lipoprotein LpoB|uniref:hypothetical protein n=1 Tax=Nubsella zeaxanthinifaciens TaxID=392412 RepID=UPI000DE2F48A|nr:hypothetical protein [Nubsella zeaxanthinifaciens]
MKIQIKTILMTLLIIAVLLLGCKKERANDVSMPSVNISKNVKSEILNWIDLHKAQGNSQIKSLSLIKSNLDFENVIFEKRNNGEDIIIIPVEQKVKGHLKIQGDYTLKLVAVKNRAKFRWAMIVAYSAENRKPALLDERTIKSIINNDVIENDGTYKFYDIKGMLLYQTTYKNKKIISYSSVRKKSDLEVGSKSLKGASQARVMEDQECIDWYLVTVYYDENGMVTGQTEEYLFTTCENTEGGGDGDGDGGGEGGGGGLEEPIDVEVTQVFELRAWFSDFDDDDYQIPTSAGSGPPMGEIPIDTPVPTQLQYICRLKVTYFPISRQITNATALAVSVTPTNSTYNNMTWGMINRNVTVFYSNQSVNTFGSTVTGTWSGILSFRWSYSAYGTQRIKQVGFSQPGTITIP